MDAKPQRPGRPLPAPVSRNENIPLNPVMQNSKTTNGPQGGYQNMYAPNLKAPAKRTAFGDVSNLVVNHNQPGKAVGKNASNVKFVPYVDNKENPAQANEAFLRPAQRPQQGAKPGQIWLPPHTNLHAQPRLSVPVQAGSSGGVHSQPVVKQTVAKKATLVYNDEIGQQKHQALNRHFKSQPQLKTEAPVLRRTQSKHLGDLQEPVRDDDEISEAPYEDAVEQLPSEEILNFRTEASGAFVKSSLPGPIGPPITCHMEPLQPVRTTAARPLDLSMEPSEPVRGTAQVHLYTSAAVLPESEEYWDEEEDDMYDEQGYTTAHSFRSHGDNTTGATTVLAPKVTRAVQKELEEAMVFVENTRSQDEIDEEEWDVSMVAEYGDDIFNYMRDLEARMLPEPHYMDMQTEIQWSMRSVLMEWLVQVHNRFSLLPETLFLTVNYIDRFLTKKIVSLGKLQLVGATAIFVAAKYEEINCPSVQEIVFMVDSGYTVDEILKAERFMLSMLGFELGWPGPMSFLRRISKADDYDLETRTLAKYFLEVTIMDERFVSTPPSALAAGAHCLSRLMLKKGEWSKAHVHYSGYVWDQLKTLVAMILECCQSPAKHHASVYEKYSDRRFKRAAIFVEEQVATGFSLPFNHSIPRQPLTGAFDDETAPIRYPPPENNGVLIAAEG